jgi:uncharacterized membrane protein YfcA
MILSPDFFWLGVVGVAAQLVDRSLGTRYAITASVFLVASTVNLVLWLQLGRVDYEAPLALLAGALVGAPLAILATRHLPRRMAAFGVGLSIFALATAGLLHGLT